MAVTTSRPRNNRPELDETSLEAAVTAVEEADVEAVAVCLLFAFAHPEHERRVGEALRNGCRAEQCVAGCWMTGDTLCAAETDHRLAARLLVDDRPALEEL